ncbi:hypothetical protein COOONC_22387 [Cooperia oncophora]
MLRPYLLLVVLQMASGFIVLPYIQIDYAHYFRLAQCQAKCTEKYGVVTTRHLLDGSTEEFLDTRNPDCEACENGCHQHRRLRGRGKGGPTSSPLHNGLRFWAESSADSGLLSYLQSAQCILMGYSGRFDTMKNPLRAAFLAKAGTTVMSSVQILCQNSIVDEEYGETVEAFLSISLLRPTGPTRYVVQWRTTNAQDVGNRDETQWITASIEPSNFIKVKGLVPGVHLPLLWSTGRRTDVRRLGETLTSSWTEVPTNVVLKAPAAPLTLKNGYNTDRGVIAHLEWPRSPQDSCYYKLQLSNSSTQSVRTYVLLPSPLDKLHYKAKAVTANFKSLPCREIHGRGSLQCPPEPVSDLSIVVRPNGTGVISWTPSADPQNILFYQIVYHALSREYGCRLRKETVNVKANVNVAEVTFPGQKCEYVVRVINYDLIGRDASVDARVLIEPAPPVRFEFELRPEYVTIAACLVFLPFGLLLLFFRRRQFPNRVSEKQQKLTEYV